MRDLNINNSNNFIAMKKNLNQTICKYTRAITRFEEVNRGKTDAQKLYYRGSKNNSSSDHFSDEGNNGANETKNIGSKM